MVSEYTRRILIFSCIFSLFLLLGCDDEAGKGRIYGTLFLPDCVEGKARDFTCPPTISLNECRAFELGVDFFALQVYPDHSATLRLQRGGSDFAITDGVIFQLRDTRKLRGRLGEPVPVGVGENVRAGLGLFDLCPGSTQNFDLTGSMTFDKFGVESDDQIKGRIELLEVRDGRGEGAGEVLGNLKGYFEFKVVTGPPYQRFQE